MCDCSETLVFQAGGNVGHSPSRCCITSQKSRVQTSENSRALCITATRGSRSMFGEILVRPGVGSSALGEVSHVLELFCIARGGGTAFKPPPSDAAPLYICTEASEPVQEGFHSPPARDGSGGLPCAGSPPPKSPRSCTSRPTRFGITSRPSSTRWACAAAGNSSARSSPSTTSRAWSPVRNRTPMGGLPEPEPWATLTDLC